MKAPNQQSESLGAKARRSTRLPITIPIAISGKDSSGKEFKENTRTLVINKHGAKIATVHQLSLGGELQVENRALGQVAPANVVWLGEKRSPKDPFEVGVQLLHAQNIWGIEFPPDDWQEGGAAAPATKAPAKESTHPPMPAPVPKPSAPAPAAVEPAKPTKPPETTPPATFPQPAKVDLMLEAAKARFEAQMLESTERNAKNFEERLASIGKRVGLQAQEDMQTGALDLQGEVLATASRRIAEQANRLETMKGEIEELLNQLRLVEDATQETLSSAQARILTARQEALEFAAQSIGDQVKHDVEAQTASLIADAHAKLEDEVNSKFRAGIAALIAEARKQLEEDTAQEFEQLTEKAREEIRTFASNFFEQTNRRLEESASEKTRGIEESVQKQIQAVSGDLVERIRTTVQEETNRQVEELHQRIRQDLESFSREFLEDTRRKSYLEADAYIASLEESARKQLLTVADELTAKTREQLERESGILTTHLKSAAEDQTAALTRDVVARLHKTTDDLLEASAHQIQSQVDDTLELFRAEAGDQTAKTLQELQQRLDEAAKQQVASIGQGVQGVQEEAQARFAQAIGQEEAKLTEKVSTAVQTIQEQGAQLASEAASAVVTETANALSEYKNALAEAFQVELQEMTHLQLETGAEQFLAKLGGAMDEFLAQHKDAALQEWQVRLQAVAQEGMNAKSAEVTAHLTAVAEEALKQQKDTALETFRSEIQQAAKTQQESLAVQFNAEVAHAQEEFAAREKASDESHLASLRESLLQEKDNLLTEFATNLNQAVEKAWKDHEQVAEQSFESALLQRAQAEQEIALGAYKEKVAEQNAATLQEFRSALQQSVETAAASAGIHVKRQADQAASRLQTELHHCNVASQNALAVYKQEVGKLTDQQLKVMREEADKVVGETAESFRAKMAEILALFQPGKKG
jgi:hypothetical protein